MHCVVEPPRLGPGQTLRGRIEFTPKRKSKINGVTSTVKCEEVCVSGSGSNRTTHRHQLVEKTIELQEACQLRRREKQTFDFEYTLPDDAPPSLDLKDNDLKWQVELRIDIPAWPDYAKTIDVIVEPSRDTERLVQAVREHQPPQDDWWTEVVGQLAASAHDPQRLSLVLEAIEDHSFELTLDILDETARPIEADHIQGGDWYQAQDAAGHRLLLHASDSVDVPQSTDVWPVKLSIIGFRPESSEIIASAKVS